MIRFADCELNLDRIVLRRGGEEIRIEPQVFDVLAYLVEHRGAVVRKEELLDAVWGDRFVSESALTTRIKAARQAVGDDGSQQLIIRTVHGKGYEFIAIVEEVEESPSGATLAPIATGTPISVPCAAADRPRDVAGTAGRDDRRPPAGHTGGSRWCREDLAGHGAGPHGRW